MSLISSSNLKKMISLIKGYIDKKADSSALADYVKKVGDTITGQLKSTVATGTAPFKVASETKVDNLNSDMVDGKHAEDFVEKSDDNNYPDMVAGSAVNLQGDTVLTHQCSYHPTGGDLDVNYEAAQIERIQGNALAWNQLVKNGNFADGINGWSSTNSGLEVSNGIISFDRITTFANTHINAINNHKYIIKADVKSDLNDTNCMLSMYVTERLYNTHFKANTTWKTIISNVLTIETNDLPHLGVRLYHDDNEVPSDTKLYFKNVNTFDLTLIYGAGNEPTTAEQFGADYQRWFGKPLEYEEYDEGSIRPVLATGIKTVGFNLYSGGDFEGEVFEWYNMGKRVLWKNDCGYTGQICMTADVTLDGASENVVYAHVFYKDGDYDYIHSTGNKLTRAGKVVEKIIASYYDGYNITVKNLCINFSWSGKRDGDYEPYWEETKAIPITSLTSNNQVIFPDGLKRVDNIYDEIFVENGITKAIKRINRVDLGTLEWTIDVQGAAYAFTKDRILLPAQSGLCFCSKIEKQYKGNDNWIAVDHNKAFRLKYLSLISDKDNLTLKESLQGVIIYYELEEPITYIIDNFQLPVTYKIDDFGTEQIIMPENSVGPIIDTRYGINAVDTIRRLPKNYISAQSESDFLRQFNAATGMDWSMAWSDEKGIYEFKNNAENHPIGLTNGCTPYYVEFPRYGYFNNIGDYEGTGTEDYLKAICKWAIKEYQPKVDNIITLIGNGNPNSVGTIILNLYCNYSVNEEGYPRYCNGIYISLQGYIVYFRFNEYKFNVLDISNTSDSLRTKHKLWGKEFDGTQDIINQISTVTSSGNLSLDGTKEIHVVTLNGNVSGITLSTMPVEGNEVVILLYGNGTEREVFLANSGIYRTPTGEDLEITVPENGYSEINMLYDGTNVWVRGI